MKNLKSLIAALLIVPALIFSSCDDDNASELDGTGTARLEATDAAVDADNITGVFLSVDEAQFIANGQVRNSITFDSPEEFNLMDFQNGNTHFLGEAELQAGAYQEVRLILTSSSQAYVEFADQTKSQINVPSGSTSGYKIKGDFEVLVDGTTELVADVDLRKALVKRGNGEYNLTPTAIFITKATVGKIEGNVNDESMQNADKVVVFAYLEGSFNESEMSEPTDGEARFENAVNSATVDAFGNFTLAFMPEGDYELIVANYSENQIENKFDFQTASSVEVTLNGNLVSIFNVSARATTSLFIGLF
ncbi:MAG: hypothetical protein ACI9Z3_001231 [Roseivirga sp.]|jgi:hypothetical protein